MKLKPDAVAKWETTLREKEFIEEGDHIVEHTKGDLWQFTSQISGNYFFTEEKFIFVASFLGTGSFSVKYGDIKALKLVNVGGVIPIIPTGILVTVKDAESGKDKKLKCSVMKRKEWVEYLRGKAGL